MAQILNDLFLLYMEKTSDGMAYKVPMFYLEVRAKTLPRANNILARTLNDFFLHMEKASDDLTYKVMMSYLEVRAKTLPRAK